MENIERKAAFLKHEYLPIIEKIAPGTPKKFGKMNVQQMIEHMADYFPGFIFCFPLSPVDESIRGKDYLR
jgi:hypothetical protein